MISLDNEEPNDLDDYEGKVVVLDYWASWCPTCYTPVTKLQEVVTENPQYSDNVAFFTVSVDSDRSKAIAVIEKNKWNHTRNVAIDFDAVNEIESMSPSNCHHRL